jgi:hypothetical protein
MSTRKDEIGHELGIIKSNFEKEIADLKNVVSGDVVKNHHHCASYLSSISHASTVSFGTAPSESIKSQVQWNEKMAKISSDDKFSTIIDGGEESKFRGGFDERRRSIMKQEINNALTRNHGESSDANESIRVISEAMALPQDE